MARQPTWADICRSTNGTFAPRGNCTYIPASTHCSGETGSSASSGFAPAGAAAAGVLAAVPVGGWIALGLGAAAIGLIAWANSD